MAHAQDQIEIITYYHNDHTGSPVAATDENGNVLWRKEYSPYGEELNKDPKAAGDRRGFTGHVQDQDLGLVYMQARYYDPVIGRFMAIDPMGVDPSASMTFNRYAYANNNPYKYVDPDGQVGKLINGGIKLIKHGGNPKKAGKEWLGDVADSISTLADPSASIADKGLAAFDLVSPISTKDIKSFTSKKAAFKQAKRDLGIPNVQQPDKVDRVPLTDRNGKKIIGPNGMPTMSKEYTYSREKGDKVVIQDHSAGHKFGQGGVGDQGPHYNVRPSENTRTGSVPDTQDHYSW